MARQCLYLSSNSMKNHVLVPGAASSWYGFFIDGTRKRRPNQAVAKGVELAVQLQISFCQLSMKRCGRAVEYGLAHRYQTRLPVSSALSSMQNRYAGVRDKTKAQWRHHLYQCESSHEQRQKPIHSWRFERFRTSQVRTIHPSLNCTAALETRVVMP